MSRDIWVTLFGLTLTALALAWVLSTGGVDADASDEESSETNEASAG